MSRPPFPRVLDSTIMAAFKSCRQKAKLEFFDHWKLLHGSVHLVAGAAYAAGQERVREAYYVEGKDPEASLVEGVGTLLAAYGKYECPPESPKSAERTAGALEYYYSHYRLGVDTAIPLSLPGGKHGIEFSFLEPIEATHPESGDPLLYSGRMDMMCSFEGMQMGLDDKTASQLGASWPRLWDLRSQFTGYTWGAGKAGIKLDGFLVRGVSILKTRYDTLQAVTYRPQWMIERWYEQLIRDVEDMKKAWEEGYWAWNLDHACSEYGGCPFRGACQMRDPTPLLQQQFERRRWDPVARTETVL